jgi:hypothetical protein
VSDPIVIDATRVRLARPRISSWLGWTSFALALAPLIVAVAAAGIMGWSKPPGWDTFMGLCWGGALIGGAGALVVRAFGRRWVDAQLRVEGATLSVRRRGADWEVLPVTVASAAAIPNRGATLHLADGRHVLVETSDERAEALVSALALDPSQRRLETAMRTSGWRAPLMAGIVVGLHALAMQLVDNVKQLTTLQAAFLLLTATISLIAVVVATDTPQVEVGADGITLRRRRGSRFVHHDAIAAATLVGGELVLTLHDGSEERVVVSEKNRAQLATAQRRIALGLAAHAREPSSAARLALLARSGRSIADWRHALEKLMQGDAGFRRAPLSADDVAAILAAPTTTPEHRIGAAMALRIAAGDHAAPQIRIAAEACAHSETRHALLRVADAEAEHAAIEEALKAASRDALASS